MKMILLAASALALGGIAHAQDAMQPPAAPPAAAPADPAMAPPPAAPADPAAAAPAAAPADPAAAPAAPAAAATDDSNLPTCSKTVTDKCKQGAGGSNHAKMHHKKK